MGQAIRKAKQVEFLSFTEFEQELKERDGAYSFRGYSSYKSEAGNYILCVLGTHHPLDKNSVVVMEDVPTVMSISEFNERYHPVMIFQSRMNESD